MPVSGAPASMQVPMKHDHEPDGSQSHCSKHALLV